MMKKIIAVAMSVAMLLLGACTAPTAEPNGNTPNAGNEGQKKFQIAKENMKVGFLHIGTIDEGYSKAHDKGRLAIEAMGIKTLYKENVPENAECEKAIRDLIDEGCNVIFSTSFNYMQYTANVAKEFPNVIFEHCSGSMLSENMGTYFGRMIEGRYLAGIVAGMKTETNKIGYVAAMPIPEVIRGINAFTLGVQSVNPEATVEVIWTNTWLDPAKEKQAALEVLGKGCDVIAQHQDTASAQIAAGEKGAFCIGYNTPTPDAAPKAYLTAPIFNWDKFYTSCVQSIIDGTWKSEAYWKGLSAGVVSLDKLTENCAEGTQAKVDEATKGLMDGTLNIFKGELKDQNGQVKVAAGSAMTDDEIWTMGWFVQGVIGTIPA